MADLKKIRSEIEKTLACKPKASVKGK